MTGAREASVPRHAVTRVSASIALLAYKFVVLSMRADPEPMHAALDSSAQCAMVKANTNAVKATACYRLKVKRRMRGIGLEQLEVLACERLNFRRQGVKALPKPR